ncbi:MAG: hypothetical protein ABIU05_18580, partial [Nitrospirales bacterium]
RGGEERIRSLRKQPQHHIQPVQRLQRQPASVREHLCLRVALNFGKSGIKYATFVSRLYLNRLIVSKKDDVAENQELSFLC